ncbi:MAG: hypothetical protein ACREKS_01130 [Candidatus Rokuibacteriota bacterium]
MRYRYSIPLLLFGMVLAAAISLAALASAQTVIGFNNESRTVLALRVSQAGLQRWVPTPWQVNPPDSGPSKDANAFLVFITPWLTQDAEGKATAVPIDRRVALAIPAKNPQTGDTTNLVARIYHSNAQALPGPYKNSVAGTVRLEQTLKGNGVEPASGTEFWEMRNGSGTIELRLQYQRGVPVRSKPETKPRSAADPTIVRLYRLDQGVDVVRSVPAGVDRVQAYSLRVTVPELRPIFDGSEQVVSISLLPWYLRQVSQP